MLLEQGQKLEITRGITAAARAIDKVGQPTSETITPRAALYSVASTINDYMLGEAYGEFYQYTLSHPLTDQSSAEEIENFDDMTEFRSEIDSYRIDLFTKVTRDLLIRTQRDGYTWERAQAELGVTFTSHQMDQGTCIQMIITSEEEGLPQFALATYIEGLGQPMNQLALQEQFMQTYIPPQNRDIPFENLPAVDVWAVMNEAWGMGENESVYTDLYEVYQQVYQWEQASYTGEEESLLEGGAYVVGEPEVNETIAQSFQELGISPRLPILTAAQAESLRERYHLRPEHAEQANLLLAALGGDGTVSVDFYRSTPLGPQKGKKEVVRAVVTEVDGSQGLPEHAVHIEQTMKAVNGSRFSIELCGSRIDFVREGERIAFTDVVPEGVDLAVLFHTISTVFGTKPDQTQRLLSDLLTLREGGELALLEQAPSPVKAKLPKDHTRRIVQPTTQVERTAPIVKEVRVSAIGLRGSVGHGFEEPVKGSLEGLRFGRVYNQLVRQETRLVDDLVMLFTSLRQVSLARGNYIERQATTEARAIEKIIRLGGRDLSKRLMSGIYGLLIDTRHLSTYQRVLRQEVPTVPTSPTSRNLVLFIDRVQDKWERRFNVDVLSDYRQQLEASSNPESRTLLSLLDSPDQLAQLYPHFTDSLTLVDEATVLVAGVSTVLSRSTIEHLIGETIFDDITVGRIFLEDVLWETLSQYSDEVRDAKRRGSKMKGLSDLEITRSIGHLTDEEVMRCLGSGNRLAMVDEIGEILRSKREVPPQDADAKDSE